MPSFEAGAKVSNNEPFVDPSADWVKDDFESDSNDTPNGAGAEPPAASKEISALPKTIVKVDSELTFTRSRSSSPSRHRSPSKDVYVEAGMSCEAKSLYEGPKKCICCINWVGKTAEEIEEAKELTRNPHGGSALLIRKRNGHGGEEPFVLHSIVIQSPLIKEALQKVLEGYPGVMPELDDLSFDAPFEPLFHRWDELTQAARDETSTETRKHLKILCETLEPEFEKSRKTLRECRMHGVITFESLWVIFKPGDLIYSNVDGQECVTRLKEVSYDIAPLGRSFFELQCENIDWDGYYFGHGVVDIPINVFKGTASTTYLSAMPLDLHPDRLAIKERLTARGEKFEKLRGYHFKSYNGAVSTFEFDLMDERPRTSINERIIIDAHAFYEFTRMPMDEFQPLKSSGLSSQSRRMRRPHAYQNPIFEPPLPYMSSSHESRGPHTSRSPRTRRNPHIGREVPYARPINGRAKRPEGDVEPLTADQLLLCVPYARGFLLKRKQWARFCVDGIQDISWNEDAFESLVLPKDEKELLLAFAEGKADTKSKFDDFIQGKGKGIIMLLSGPPGVGKTLTAESVAETMRVPLYTMSAGELGTYSEGVESMLKDVLEKCAMWKAVLLLDEADVFLERRTLGDLDRNAMVSVLLRLLEYYEGIMFLTTNRVEAFDPAFESRIDVAVNYPTLTFHSRRQIWSNFIMRLPSEERNITGKDLDLLAEMPLNGRQIKSAAKTAQILAGRKKEPLSLDHTSVVLRLRAHLLEGNC